MPESTRENILLRQPPSSGVEGRRLTMLGALPSVARIAVLMLPLLILYVIVVVVFARDAFQGDESRYVQYAANLLSGSYADPVYVLWSGPGYPLVLAPFLALGAPWLLAKLLNAVFLYGGVIYVYRTLGLYVDRRTATIAALVTGLYPPVLQELPALLTEPLAFFLVTAFCFYYCQSLRAPRAMAPLMLAAISLAWLALTKLFFGYVIVVALLSFGIGSLARRRSRAQYRRSAVMCLVALLFCVPYLVYTYTVTGKAFYWGNTGGTVAYWMSTPFRDELGDCNGFPGQLRPRAELEQNHGVFFDRLARLPAIEWDDELKKQAVRNILGDPMKFVHNWGANVGRLLFSYPFSYTPQKLSTFVYLIPNMFLVVAFVLLIPAAWLGRASIPFELTWLVGVAAIAFLGSSLVCGYHRYVQILVPIVIIWIAYVATETLEIKIRTGQGEPSTP